MDDEELVEADANDEDTTVVDDQASHATRDEMDACLWCPRTTPAHGRPRRRPAALAAAFDRVVPQVVRRHPQKAGRHEQGQTPHRHGSARFCVDYRDLNAITRKDVYPLPRIDETLDALGGCSYFTTLDLANGYWRVLVEEGDCDKTAMITKYGTHRFRRMLFRLCNAPGTSQRLMDNTLRAISWLCCLVYLDDIIVHT